MSIFEDLSPGQFDNLLRVNMNAADAMERFESAKVEYPLLSEDVDPAVLTRVLGIAAQRLFVLTVFLPNDERRTVKLQFGDTDGIKLISKDPIESLGTFVVARKPMPHVVAPHADLRFSFAPVSPAN